MKKQNYQQFRDIQLIESQRVKAILPAFLLAPSTWTGTSIVLAEIAIGNTWNFSFLMPIVPFGVNFVPAVRWQSGTVIYRYKFWTANEVLYYPVYDGQRIGTAAIIEIWSVNSTSAPENDAAVTLEISPLVFPPNPCASCCAQPDQQMLLYLSPPFSVPVGDPRNPFTDTMVL